MRKTVLINEGCKVAWLGEVLLVRVQICIRVMQGGPLMTGGGGQLLLICCMVVLWVEGGRFICRCKILQHKGGGSDQVGWKREKYRQAKVREIYRYRELGTHLGRVRQWGFLRWPLHSESITEKEKNSQSSMSESLSTFSTQLFITSNVHCLTSKDLYLLHVSNVYSHKC